MTFGNSLRYHLAQVETAFFMEIFVLVTFRNNNIAWQHSEHLREIPGKLEKRLPSPPNAP